jgi:hypothetical protein
MWSRLCTQDAVYTHSTQGRVNTPHTSPGGGGGGRQQRDAFTKIKGCRQKKRIALQWFSKNEKISFLTQNLQHYFLILAPRNDNTNIPTRGVIVLFRKKTPPVTQKTFPFRAKKTIRKKQNTAMTAAQLLAATDLAPASLVRSGLLL